MPTTGNHRSEFSSKYEGIGQLLDRHKGKSRITLAFGDIEKETGSLPDSARRFASWWANNRTTKMSARHCRVWLSRGYRTRHVDLTGGMVTFVKGRKLRTRLSTAEMVLEASLSLFDEGLAPFSRRDVAIRITHLHPQLPLKLQALDPAIQAMVTGSGSGRLVAERWRGTLTRLRRGSFTLSTKGRRAAHAIATPPPGRGRSLLGHVKAFFRDQEGLKLAKGALTLGPGLSVPMDLVSHDRKTAVKVFPLKSREGDRERGGRRATLFQTLFAMEKAGVKRPILVLCPPPGRSTESLLNAFVKAHRPLLGRLEVYGCVRTKAGAVPAIGKR
jgi:hypothetical protein